jgi:hypothetical protein
MRHFLWFILVSAGLAAAWWAELRGLAVLVTLVSGLAGLTYLVIRNRRPVPEAEQRRDTRDVERDIPPPPGW